MPTPKSRSNRPGFSLVELLIVIAIIAVLAALSVGIIRAVLDSQQKANTEAAMRTVDKTLKQHWAHVVGEARKEAPSQDVLALAKQDPRRAQVIWIKLRLTEAFPQSYAEVGKPGAIPAWQSYVPSNQKYNSTYRRTLTSAHIDNPPSADVQSSTCLLLALGVRRGGAGLNVAELGPAARDTNGDGLKEIVDGWGRPIVFDRFPTDAKFPGLLQSNSPAILGSKGDKYCDPLDPDGLLANPNWFSASFTTTTSKFSPANLTLGAEFEQLCHPVFFQSTPTPVANYVIPVLTSKGGDSANAGDDIHSFSMRQD